jgi:cytochrome c5
LSERRGTEFGSSVVILIAVGIVVAVVYGLTAAQFAVPVGAGTPKQIAARLAPVGSVKIATATAAAPPAAASAAAPEAKAVAPAGGVESIGKARFEDTCSACHATGVAGAPKVGDKNAWAPRIAQGMDALLHSAINGKNAMPPRGTCATCSDDELKAAIEYMVLQSK